jgi:hypothetical protein
VAFYIPSPPVAIYPSPLTKQVLCREKRMRVPLGGGALAGAREKQLILFLLKN